MLGCRIFWIVAIVSTAATADDTSKIIGDFALRDQNGREHQLRKYSESDAVVLLSIDQQCSKFLRILDRYNSLRKGAHSPNIVFFAIDSTSRAKGFDAPNRYGTVGADLPILIDDSLLITESLGMHRAGDLAIVDPASGEILYNGTIEASEDRVISAFDFSSWDSAVSIVEILSAMKSDEDGQKFALPGGQTESCEPFLQGEQINRESPDYTTEVAPILKEKCVHCHSRGGIVPFAMDSHEVVKGWSSMIKEALLTRRMPPMQVDPRVKHFANANYIEPSEMRILIRWIDEGALFSENLDDPLKRVSPSATQWQLGEPDHILQLPAFRVPATGVLDYENVTIDLPFTNNVWIKSVHFIPGDRRVLHHLMSYIAPRESRLSDAASEETGAWKFLEGYAPGKDGAVTFPHQTGVFIPAGSSLEVSLHYTTFGKEVVDQTSIGLYFADEDPRYEYSTYALSNGGSNISIPPGVEEYKMSSSHTFEDAIMLYGLRPHMHYRGKYMRMSVEYLDGTVEDIINVPNYNFAWQPTYRLSEPMLLPSGSRVIVDGAFDNSRQNLGNPDPDAWVRGGAQSWDEMFIGYFSYHRIRK